MSDLWSIVFVLVFIIIKVKFSLGFLTFWLFNEVIFLGLNIILILKLNVWDTMRKYSVFHRLFSQKVSFIFAKFVSLIIFDRFIRNYEYTNFIRYLLIYGKVVDINIFLTQQTKINYNKYFSVPLHHFLINFKTYSALLSHVLD